MSAERFEFSKDNLDFYLKELAKEIKAEYGKNIHFELILVGGAAIMSSYGFRNMTTDIDAEIPVELKVLVKQVGDKMGLPGGWLNSDFKKTDSYSPNIRLYSKPYKNFLRVLEVRVIKDEYLIAMKLKSARYYKRDISDIIGIINEMRHQGKNPRVESVKTAIVKLYGHEAAIDAFMNQVITRCMTAENLDSLYEKYALFEDRNKGYLLEFEKKYPDVLSEKYLTQILQNAQDVDDEFMKQLEESDTEHDIVIHELDENGCLIIPEDEPEAEGSNREQEVF